MTDLELQFLEELNQLRHQYLTELQGRLTRLSLLAQDYSQSPNDQLFQELYRHIHNLKGSGSSFGFTQISELAHHLEQRCRRDQDPVELAEQVEQFILQLNALKQHLQPLSRIELPTPLEHNGRLIYLVEDDEELAQLIRYQLKTYGFEVEHFTHLSQLEQALSHKRPAALLVDLLLPDGNGADRLKQIQSSLPAPLPVLFISVHDDFNHRLQAVRAGGSGYFVKPLDIHQLAEQLTRLINPQDSDAYKVLIVEDSAALAEYFCLILNEAGIDARYETDPLKALDRLVDFRPEIMILDLYMPQCSGLELASIIRQHGSFVTLPILFLSGESDQERQLQAIRCGGDDFLQKPVDPKQLVAAIYSRSERARQLSQLVIRDNLTGLLNHSAAKYQIEQELARAKREQGQFSVVMLDLDHFKRVNDNFGHLTGDRVLRALAALLRQRLRKSDSIGRYGGEEFLLVLPDTSAQQAMELLEQCRIALHQMPFYERATGFHVSFSYGIASYPEFKVEQQLLEQADQALYQAKDQGRNQGVIAQA